MTLGPLCSFAAKGPWLGSFRERKHCPVNSACESDSSMEGFILGLFVAYIHRRIDGVAPSPPSPSSPSLSMSSSPPSRRRRRIFATSITSSPRISIYLSLSVSLLLFLSLSRSREGGGRQRSPLLLLSLERGRRRQRSSGIHGVRHVFVFRCSSSVPKRFRASAYWVLARFLFGSGGILFVSYSVYIA